MIRAMVNYQGAPTKLDDLRPMDVAGRVGRVRAEMATAGVDALLVSELVNVRYLSGFTGSAGVVVIRPDDTVFITDGRYAAQAPQELAAAGVGTSIDIEIIPTGSTQKDHLVSLTGSLGRLGLEAQSVSWATQRAYADALAPELVATDGLVEALRLVKDDGELDRMAAAAAIADAALATIRPMLAEGPREIEVARALDAKMLELGASAPSFDTIVAAGTHGAMPHAQPGEGRLSEGDLVVIDFGAIVDGYCSDMTRTFQLGDVGDERRLMWDVVAAAQRAGVDAVRAGASAVEVDRQCRDIIAEAGWADAFSHGTGHGVGLLIHEAPRVSSASSDILAARQVVTVEPGVYLAELGGVRIEDSVVVTDDGCDLLTLSPKDPVVA